MPGSEDPEATACELTWSAKVTLVRTGQEVIDDGAPVPTTTSSTPTPTPTPAPAPAPSPAPAPVDASRSEQAMADAVHRAIEEQRAQEAASDGAKADAVSRAIREHLQQGGAPTASGSGAQADVVLPAGSTGRLSATAIAQRNAARGTPLGSAPLRAGGSPRAAAGTSRLRATLRFDAADRRALRRKRFVALTLRVRVPGVAAPVVVRKVVRAPR